MTRTRTPAEPEDSLSPHALRFPPVLFAGNRFPLRKLPQPCFPGGSGESSLVHRSSPMMQDAIAIHGHDIIDLVATYPDGIRLSQLMEIVDGRFGKSVTFHTCSAMGMNLDELLHFLEARDKVRIVSGVVYPGGSPACEH